jgi:hypothetical protein
MGAASRTYLVESSSFALRVLHHSISNVFVVYPVPEGDSYDGSNPNCMSLCVWIIVCEIASDVHHGSTPAIETEDFVSEIDDLPAFGVGELHSVSPRTRGDVFRTEFLVQLGLEGREFRLFICRKVDKRGVVGSTGEGILRVISSMHGGIERSRVVCGY